MYLFKKKLSQFFRFWRDNLDETEIHYFFGSQEIKPLLPDRTQAFNFLTLLWHPTLDAPPEAHR